MCSHTLSSDRMTGCHWRCFHSFQMHQFYPKWSPWHSHGEGLPPSPLLSLQQWDWGFNGSPSPGFAPSFPRVHTVPPPPVSALPPVPPALGLRCCRSKQQSNASCWCLCLAVRRGVCKCVRKETVCSFYFLWKNILMLKDKTMLYFCTRDGWMDGGIQGLSLNNLSRCLVWKLCS